MGSKKLKNEQSHEESYEDDFHDEPYIEKITGSHYHSSKSRLSQEINESPLSSIEENKFKINKDIRSNSKHRKNPSLIDEFISKETKKINRGKQKEQNTLTANNPKHTIPENLDEQNHRINLKQNIYQSKQPSSFDEENKISNPKITLIIKKPDTSLDNERNKYSHNIEDETYIKYPDGLSKYEKIEDEESKEDQPIDEVIESSEFKKFSLLNSTHNLLFCALKKIIAEVNLNLKMKIRILKC